jgi:hypothetical protein
MSNFLKKKALLLFLLILPIFGFTFDKKINKEGFVINSSSTKLISNILSSLFYYNSTDIIDLDRYIIYIEETKQNENFLGQSPADNALIFLRDLRDICVSEVLYFDNRFSQYEKYNNYESYLEKYNEDYQDQIDNFLDKEGVKLVNSILTLDKEGELTLEEKLVLDLKTDQYEDLISILDSHKLSQEQVAKAKEEYLTDDEKSIKDKWLVSSMDEKLLMVINGEAPFDKLHKQINEAVTAKGLENREYLFFINYEDVFTEDSLLGAATAEKIGNFYEFTIADPTDFHKDYLFRKNNYNFEGNNIGIWETYFKPEHIDAFQAKLETQFEALGYSW